MKMLIPFHTGSVLAILLLGCATLYAQHSPSPFAGSNLPMDPVVGNQIHVGTRMVKELGAVPNQQAIAKSGLRSLAPVTSDYEMESFKQGDADFTMYEGVTHSLRAAYNHGSADGKWEARLGFSEAIQDNKDVEDLQFTHSFGVAGRYYIKETDLLRLSSGLGADWIVIDESLKEMGMVENRSQYQLNVNTVLQIFQGEKTVVAGLQALQSFYDKGYSTDVGLAVLYGMSLNPLFAVNFDALFRRTLVAYSEDFFGDMNKVKFSDAPHTISLGGAGTYYFSDKFGANLGYRTTLGVEELSVHTFLLGGRFAF